MQAQEAIASHTLNHIQENLIKLRTQYLVAPKFAEYQIFYFIQYTVSVNFFFFFVWRICIQKSKTCPTIALHSTFYTEQHPSFKRRYYFMFVKNDVSVKVNRHWAYPNAKNMPPNLLKRNSHFPVNNVSIKKANRLTVFKEIIAVIVRFMWNTNAVCGKNAEFLNVKTGGTRKIYGAIKNTSRLITPKLKHILVFCGSLFAWQCKFILVFSLIVFLCFSMETVWFLWFFF